MKKQRVWCRVYDKEQFKSECREAGVGPKCTAVSLWYIVKGEGNWKALEKWFCPPEEQKRLNNPPIVGYVVFSAAGVRVVEKKPRRNRAG